MIDSELSSIFKNCADAIRYVNGQTLSTYYPSQFASAISALKHDVPYDAEIEYLESDVSGTFWINTSRYPTLGLVLDYEIKFMSPTFSGTEQEVWGSWGGGVNWNCWSNKNESTLLLRSGQRGANTISIMGNTLTPSKSSTTPVTIFGWKNGTYSTHNVKVYYYKVKDSNGNLILDYIPVRIGRFGYMYDRISETLIGNAGRGNFILGPDKT